MSNSRKQAQGKQPSQTIVLCDFAIEGLVGPNGYPVGYTKKGDKVEWSPPDAKSPNDEPMLLQRNSHDIRQAYNEFRDMVWWNRHQLWLQEIASDPTRLTEEQKPILQRARKTAKRIEKQYGRENLGWDDFDWGLLNGRMSALAWVMGTDWEVTLDT